MERERESEGSARRGRDDVLGRGWSDDGRGRRKRDPVCGGRRRRELRPIEGSGLSNVTYNGARREDGPMVLHEGLTTTVPEKVEFCVAMVSL